MQFAVQIELGNNAMQTSGDVADALEKIAVHLRRTGEAERFTADDLGTGANVRDSNGNTVGVWTVRASYGS